MTRPSIVIVFWDIFFFTEESGGAALFLGNVSFLHRSTVSEQHAVMERWTLERLEKMNVL